MSKTGQTTVTRPSTEALVTLGDRVHEAASQEGISLDYHDGLWTATDTTTGERATDLSMAGAWAGLRETDVYAVHALLEERGASIVRPSAFLDE
ncbi:hypothetical protein [Salinigranum marinum]|uniref:hypothetical protein n=1 Tax=Salinigranum marinum TaxID=1515595 RepID=UPI002989A142|nr:hypothetical protein [Salinigranum marinum]